MGGNRHIVKRLDIALNFEREVEADELVGVVKRSLLEGTEAIFDRLFPKGTRLRIPKLIVEVGEIPAAAFAAEFPKRFACALEKALEELEMEKLRVDESREESWSLLKAYLERGILPWWYSAGQEKSIAGLLKVVRKESGKELQQWLRKHGGKRNVLKRLGIYMDKGELLALLKEGQGGMGPRQFAWIEALAHILAGTKGRMKTAKMERILILILLEAPGAAEISALSQRAFIQHILRGLPGKLGSTFFPGGSAGQKMLRDMEGVTRRAKLPVTLRENILAELRESVLHPNLSMTSKPKSPKAMEETILYFLTWASLPPWAASLSKQAFQEELDHFVLRSDPKHWQFLLRALETPALQVQLRDSLMHRILVEARRKSPVRLLNFLAAFPHSIRHSPYLKPLFKSFESLAKNLMLHLHPSSTAPSKGAVRRNPQYRRRRWHSPILDSSSPPEGWAEFLKGKISLEKLLEGMRQRLVEGEKEGEIEMQKAPDQPARFWLDLLRHFLLHATWPWWGKQALGSIRGMPGEARFPEAHRRLLLILGRLSAESPDATRMLLLELFESPQVAARLLHSLPREALSLILQLLGGREHRQLPRQLSAFITLLNHQAQRSFNEKRLWQEVVEWLLGHTPESLAEKRPGPFWRGVAFLAASFGLEWPQVRSLLERFGAGIPHLPAFPSVEELAELFPHGESKGNWGRPPAPHAELQNDLIDLLQQLLQLGALPAAFAGMRMDLLVDAFQSLVWNKDLERLKALVERQPGAGRSTAAQRRWSIRLLMRFMPEKALGMASTLLMEARGLDIRPLIELGNALRAVGPVLQAQARRELLSLSLEVGWGIWKLPATDAVGFWRFLQEQLLPRLPALDGLLQALSQGKPAPPMQVLSSPPPAPNPEPATGAMISADAELFSTLLTFHAYLKMGTMPSWSLWENAEALEKKVRHWLLLEPAKARKLLEECLSLRGNAFEFPWEEQGEMKLETVPGWEDLLQELVEEADLRLEALEEWRQWRGFWQGRDERPQKLGEWRELLHWLRPRGQRNKWRRFLDALEQKSRGWKPRERMRWTRNLRKAVKMELEEMDRKEWSGEFDVEEVFFERESEGGITAWLSLLRKALLAQRFGTVSQENAVQAAGVFAALANGGDGQGEKVVVFGLLHYWAAVSGRTKEMVLGKALARFSQSLPTKAIRIFEEDLGGTPLPLEEDILAWLTLETGDMKRIFRSAEALAAAHVLLGKRGGEAWKKEWRERGAVMLEKEELGRWLRALVEGEGEQGKGGEWPEGNWGKELRERIRMKNAWRIDPAEMAEHVAARSKGTVDAREWKEIGGLLARLSAGNGKGRFLQWLAGLLHFHKERSGKAPERVLEAWISAGPRENAFGEALVAAFGKGEMNWGSFQSGFLNAAFVQPLRFAVRISICIRLTFGNTAWKLWLRAVDRQGSGLLEPSRLAEFWESCFQKWPPKAAEKHRIHHFLSSFSPSASLTLSQGPQLVRAVTKSLEGQAPALRDSLPEAGSPSAFTRLSLSELLEFLRPMAFVSLPQREWREISAVAVQVAAREGEGGHQLLLSILAGYKGFRNGSRPQNLLRNWAEKAKTSGPGAVHTVLQAAAEDVIDRGTKIAERLLMVYTLLGSQAWGEWKKLWKWLGAEAVEAKAFGSFLEGALDERKGLSPESRSFLERHLKALRGTGRRGSVVPTEEIWVRLPEIQSRRRREEAEPGQLRDFLQQFHPGAMGGAEWRQVGDVLMRVAESSGGLKSRAFLLAMAHYQSGRAGKKASEILQKWLKAPKRMAQKGAAFETWEAIRRTMEPFAGMSWQQLTSGAMKGRASALRPVLLAAEILFLAHVATEKSLSVGLKRRLEVILGKPDALRSPELQLFGCLLPHERQHFLQASRSQAASWFRYLPVLLEDLLAVGPERGAADLRSKEGKWVARLVGEMSKASTTQGSFMERVRRAPMNRKEKEARRKKAEEERRARRKDWTESDESEENIYVQNAGMVILWPFLTRFFRNLGFLDGDDFKGDAERERAVFLLQFLVDSGEPPPEYLLALNKLLAGWTVADAVDLPYPLSSEEKRHCSQLLAAVKSYWKPLANTSIEGMQRSFFQREGILARKGEHWNLKIEKKGMDILVTKLNWSISMVNLSFNDIILYVEWI